ncbi:MAG: ATP-binding protein [Candidatus Rokuibacteriota bacterium]
MGETRVDLLRLLEDLRDAYPGPTDETILTEIVANALDSGAGTITVLTDPAAGTFTLVDDGLGMRRRELARYHDLAISSKTRGQGIGFAGVGIKLALLVSREVVTETRRGGKHVATSWALGGRQRAPWRWVTPPGLVGARGTAVRLTLENPLAPLLDAGFIEAALRRHFQTLLEPFFDEILAAQYPRGIRFAVNGRSLATEPGSGDQRAALAVRMARKRKPSAIGYLVRDGAPLSEERRGLAVSTFGKVIKGGWDWLGVTPAAGDRIGGLIEAPALAECLTLNKGDFVRSGARGALYLAYRKAIQEAVSAQLARWGDAPVEADRSRRRAARPVERDLETVLVDLAEDFPLLASLVERRSGGQRALPVDGRGGGGLAPSEGQILTGAPDAPLAPDLVAGPAPAPTAPEASGSRDSTRGTAPMPEVAAPPSPGARDVSGEGRGRRPGRYGLSIQFAARPDDVELGRLVDATVWVNEAHPAYRRAAASRSEGYHVALAVALCLGPLAVEPAREHAFVTAFLASWGGALERRSHRPRRRARD